MTNISSRDTTGASDSSDSTGGADDRIDAELYGRYLTGEVTEEERLQVERWATTPWRKRLLAAADGTQAPDAQRAARAWTVLWRRIAPEGQGMHQSIADHRVSRHTDFSGHHIGGMGAFGKQILQRWAWPAGLIAFAAIVAAFLSRPHRQDFGTSRQYTTAIAQRATLFLDDGTRVMMAPQTTLRLVRFGQHSRTIVLDGDAYFDVAPSARVPFVVQAGAGTIRVLGTRFEVKHYPGTGPVQVAVATGKVLVSSSAWHSAVLVTAGHALSATDSIQTVRAVDNIDTEIGWLGDQLVFQEAPIGKVLETLTRWYGYRFRYADSATARQSVTIGLSMKSSTEALATLEKILDVHLTIVGDTVTLIPAHVRTAPGPRAKRYDIWLPTREVGR